MGFSVAVALVEVEKIERPLMLLPAVPGIDAEWKRLVVRACRTGRASSPRSSGRRDESSFGRAYLTFNTGVFGRYGVEVPEPASVAS
jgi:hypothetical protein